MNQFSLESLKLEQLRVVDFRLSSNKTLLKFLALAGVGLFAYKTIQIHLMRRSMSHQAHQQTGNLNMK